MEKSILTVTQVCEYTKNLLESDEILSGVYVKGEISNLTYQSSGHIYFSFKDQGATLRAVIFRMNASRLKFKLESGMKVIAHGRLSFYPPNGSCQMIATSLEPDGIGSLYLAFEQLKKNLEAEGLFDPRAKKQIPYMPGRIGIITSPTGAAVRDMINVSGRRFPMAELVLFPCLVQGEGAAEQIAAGVKFFNRRNNVDVIILGRGGGSLEDLWEFNSELLARTIYASKIPIISAVGHETDFSISDFAADLRAPTPSAAAELALPDEGKVRTDINTLANRMAAAVSKNIELKRKRIEALAETRVLTDPTASLDERRLRVSHLEDMLFREGKAILERKKSSLGQIAATLSALDPMSVIGRGYSAVFDKNNKLIKSYSDVNEGDNIEFRLKDGKVKAVVTEKEAL